MPEVKATLDAVEQPLAVNVERRNAPLHYIFLLYPAILIFPFQDTFLWNSPLGYFGAAPSGIPILAFVLYDAIFHRSTLAETRRWNSPLIWLILALLVSAGVGIASLSLYTGASINLVNKTITMAILYGIVLYLIFIPPALYRGMIYCGFISLIVALLGLLVCDILNISEFQFPSLFHASPLATQPRGFSIELSMLGATLPCTIMLIAMLTRNAPLSHLLFWLSLASAVLVASKGATGAAFIAAGIYILFNRRIALLGRVLLFVAAATIASTLLVQFLDRIVDESERYTSVGTRSVYLILSFTTLLDHPAGVGFGGFTPFFLRIGPSVEELNLWLQLTPQQLAEARTYYTSQSEMFVGTKTLLGDCLLIWGIPGALFAIYFLATGIYRVMAWRGSSVISGSAAFSVISLVTFVPGTTLYIVPLVAGLALRALRERTFEAP